MENILCEHYPAYVWSVKLDEDHGMVYIINNTIQSELQSNMMYGYRFKLSTIYGDPSLKKVINAGGEILERANQPRGWWKGDKTQFVEGVPGHIQPNAIRIRVK